MGAILDAVDMPVQLGGGIRDMATIEAWLERGVDRVILGTVAVRDPDLVRAACRAYPGRIAVGIDARNGRVAVEGWAETVDMEALELARRFEDAGASAIIHTDIARDGVLEGVAAAATGALARALATPVIASGGVASHADLAALKAYEADGVCGVICGRALYDGRIDPAQGAGTACRLIAPIPRHAEDAHHPVPRRPRRAGGQGRELRQSGGCRRPGGAGQGLRRAGRGRALLSGHHRLP